MYSVPDKLAAASMASDITAVTGVKTEFTSGTPAADTKAVIVKAYIMKYGQLSFTNAATQDDIDRVFSYLNNNYNGNATIYGPYIKNILNPALFNTPGVYADYLIELVDGTTFSQASAGYGRTDDLSDMNQFCVVSGTGVIKNAAVNSANVADLASNVCHILGINAPANNEGSLWNIYDFVEPLLTVTFDGEKNSDGLYQSAVTVTLEGTDNNGQVTLQYDTGNGYKAYMAPILMNTDCTLKLKAIDTAGNTVEKTEAVQFVKMLEDVHLEGDSDTAGGFIYTDSDSITVSGSVYLENTGLTVTVNGEQVEIDSMAFSKNISLVEGENNITVNAALNGIGNNKTLTIYRVYDPVITSIADGAAVAETPVNIGGNAATGSSVTVNGISAVVGPDGSFSTNIGLVEGENSISVIAASGKYVKQTDLTVSYYIPAVINITNLVDKQVVKTQKITVEGTVDKACNLTVNGVAATIKDDLRFSSKVRLDKGVNEITVEADYNGVKSSKTIQVVYVLPDYKYVVYINWDGFARYYYDLANQGTTARTPVINELISQGVFFENAYTGIPAITNAMQPAIVSGAWPATTGNETGFMDVKPGDYYYEAICTAKALGITEGVGNNRFQPESPITRQDMMQLTVKAMQLAGMLKEKEDISILDQMKDAGQISDYARDSIALLVKNGIVKGNGGAIMPKAYLTMAEAAVIIYRIYNF